MKASLVRSIVLTSLIVTSALAIHGHPSPAQAATRTALTRCFVGQLSVQRIASSGAMGHLGVLFALHNHSNRTCTLYGFPGAQLLTAAKKPLPTHVIRGDGYISGIQRKKTLVQLAPGASGYFVMEWAHIPSPGQKCPSAPFVRITPPNDYNSILVHIKLGGIDACGGILDVTPLSATRYAI